MSLIFEIRGVEICLYEAWDFSSIAPREAAQHISMQAMQVSWQLTAEVPAQHRRQRFARGALPGGDLVGWIDLEVAQEQGPVDVVRFKCQAVCQAWSEHVRNRGWTCLLDLARCLGVLTHAANRSPLESRIAHRSQLHITSPLS